MIEIFRVLEECGGDVRCTSFGKSSMMHRSMASHLIYLTALILMTILNSLR